MKASLSVAFADLRGKAGDLVAQGSPTGVVLRPRTVPHNPNTPAQRNVRRDLARATAAYRDMPPDLVEAWRAYASTRTKTDPVTGHTYSPSAVAVFTGLATKLLQVHTAAALPFPPPTHGFAGDTITVTASISESLSPKTEDRGLRTENLSLPPDPRAPNPDSRGLKTEDRRLNTENPSHLPSPRGLKTEDRGLNTENPSHLPCPQGLKTEDRGLNTEHRKPNTENLSSLPPRPDTRDPSPAVVFTTTGPNLPGVTTELLLQPLVSPNRTPKLRDYRTQLFAAFTPAHLTATVPVTPGYYVAAYRFVETATGQSTPLIEAPGVLFVP